MNKIISILLILSFAGSAISRLSEDKDPPSENVTLGHWSDGEMVLLALKTKMGYYLVQTDRENSYFLPRGKNLLNDHRTVITNREFSLEKIISVDSDLGGLYPASNFPYEYITALGYKKSDTGLWVKNLIYPKSLNFVQYPLPKEANTTDWSKFPDLNLPEGISHVGGYGFPVYANELLQNGKINLLAKGFSNLPNLHALPRKDWDGKNSYYFNQLFYLIRVAARNMVKQGKTGSEFGNIEEIANGDNSDANIPYNRLTIAGAIELGKYIYYSSSSSNSIDNPNYDIPQNEAVIMLDEESMTNHKWEGGQSYALYGYLNQGMMEAAGPNYRIFWYAQPVQRFWLKYIHVKPEDYTMQDIEGLFDPNNILMNSQGWKNSTWYVDASGAYSKVPFLSNAEIYEKKGGKFILENGKRKFRSEGFSLKIFQSVTPILVQPHDYIKYALHNKETNEERFGKDFVVIHKDGTASIKSEFARLGFKWNPNGISQPNPKYWQPETKLWVEGIYRRANGIMSDLLMLAKLEKDEWNITHANTRYKLYGEHRPKTEPWTFGGNSVQPREVGESQIFYDTFMLLLSGGQAISSWDDGYWKDQLPNKGEPLYGNNDYWGRYQAKLAAVQTVMKPLEGSKSTDWTYVHFYYPYWGEKNSEVISSGIYYKGKLYVFFLNPTLENNEKQRLDLQAAGKSFKIELNGHELYHKVLDVPSGLTPKDFKLSYTTIYGRKVKVNGLVTNKINEHYE